MTDKAKFKNMHLNKDWAGSNRDHLAYKEKKSLIYPLLLPYNVCIVFIH